MFQSVASFFINSLIGQATDDGANNASEVENDSHTLKTEDREDDWVVVVSKDDGTDCDAVEGRCSRPLTRSSSTSSVLSSETENSWFITPPPCFTSQGPVNMETSPLENLLIEHPSMSVYHFHPKGRHFLIMPPRSDSSDSCDSDEEDAEVVDIEDIEVLEEEKEEPEAADVAVYAEGQMEHHFHVQQMESQAILSKRAQKIKIKKAYRSLNRGYLQRNNKAREVNSRNRRQRRGERSQGSIRSNANNNRKC